MTNEQVAIGIAVGFAAIAYGIVSRQIRAKDIDACYKRLLAGQVEKGNLTQPQADVMYSESLK